MITAHPLLPRDFDAVWTIYSEAIPPAEQKPRDVLLADTSRPGYRFLTAKDNDNVVGMSALFVDTTAGFALLEYLAVARIRRGSGIGTLLLEATLQAARQNHPSLPVLIEVDAPANAETTRRKSFYTRHGCRQIVGCRYQLPLTHAIPPAMQLLIHQIDRAPTLPLGTLRSWLTSIYVNVYRQPQNDPRIDQMLSGLPPAVFLA